ncbi:hypothetical protein A3K48_03600 [candidate division WOR-1 bacterium RIFOXYA12_FULL_52_29]|uniref:UPF0251 protein A3K49_03600 n=1 Tax=candidate division WOR-1 bacterium RIFOXYC12_FULL_54_18 TaxID=1802584 RepID=A0A1F4T5J4_UNCSA|nr:MAG: hypothetical protein A3K44_03600 [candidate division WOR-1 bacterium RIFOXYA2_FULL_51_19]OGC17648.1 MAG: hypothetical protein A3K48_03600 [candidate division WOR-1 bacterium RIFOXYA12_FULL_52_29]OGC26505.1 MAG: hypothetical protein A3K32_03595 [candidate division WOR-1 bacterium RIFOXYB2_FULL_45_9]OGC28065.1 MAG: hypothetical protein A3K49_03600 [candidate division WOR-1 bacterium RIFOXYC12_FULL_54_18]OGC29649.1 MAG: hypothetical protein A2346_02735 [candidate division WOR-1 bacterium R
MTPRQRKGRVCRPFMGDGFYKPRAMPLSSLEIILLGHDEIEAMRLCDHEGLEQEEAAMQMNISRGTLQRLLYAGRKKTIEAITQGKALQIEGGEHIVPRGRGRRRCGQGW